MFNIAFQVTLLLLSVANCDDISRNPPPKNVSIESLRCIVSVGDVLHAHCVLKVREILPKTIICQAYGSTEAGSVTIFNLNCKEDLCLSFEHPDSCGRPRRGVQYKVKAKFLALDNIYMFHAMFCSSIIQSVFVFRNTFRLYHYYVN